jgi:hypothetical protein
LFLFGFRVSDLRLQVDDVQLEFRELLKTMKERGMAIKHANNSASEISSTSAHLAQGSQFGRRALDFVALAHQDGLAEGRKLGAKIQLTALVCAIDTVGQSLRDHIAIMPIIRML